MDDLLTDFLAEAAEMLDEASGAIVAWEKDPGDRERLDEIFRFVHTIKGSSGFLTLPRVTALAHAAEDALDQVRRGDRVADAALVSAVLAIIDRLGDLCAILGKTGTEPEGADQDVIAPLNGAAIDAGPVVAAAPSAPAHDDVAAAMQNWRSIRVPLPLLDSVMTGITDMVLARNDFARLLREMGRDAALSASFDRLSDSIAGMRQSVSQMRMQRIDKLFAPLPRIARDLAADLGKQVQVLTSGSEIELDREMIENIRDPLTHIIRNAIDHGLESAAERTAVGKDSVGRISVTARQSGNQIEIEIADDGRGIATDKLVAKALAAKIISSAEAGVMTPRQKLDLIFSPGLSTAASVTAISGRGVGMDIVKSNIEKIGGVVEIRNDEGHGLVIILRVPMTLTIISGLLVSASSQHFAIPRGAVREILLESNDSVRFDRLGGGEFVTVRGERLALIRLENVLGSDMAPIQDSDDEDRALVIIRPGQDHCYALSVAAIHDHEELVIKPAAPLIMATGLYAGTTLPDNGRPVLLLDALGLPAVMGTDTNAAANIDIEAIAREGDALLANRTRGQLLLFRDMDQSIRAINLSVIERVEEVAAADIFESAGCIQVHIGGAILPVHANAVPATGEKVKLLRLQDGRHELCYPIDSVIDIIRMTDSVKAAKVPGLIAGIILVSGEPIELIDPYWLMEQVAGGSRRSERKQNPLCRLAADNDGWAANFLAPILRASGYRIITETSGFDDEVEDVVLCVTEGGMSPSSPEVPVVRLRATVLANGPDDDSIYRYDRAALLSALRLSVAGAGQ